MGTASALKWQQGALCTGLFLVAGFCLFGAWDQTRTGETFGLSGKGRVLRNEEPGYFAFLFWARLFVGVLNLAGGVFLAGKIFF